MIHDDASEDFENSRTVNKNQKDKDKVENLQSDSKPSNDAKTANISKQINDQKEKSAGRKKVQKESNDSFDEFLKDSSTEKLVEMSNKLLQEILKKCQEEKAKTKSFSGGRSIKTEPESDEDIFFLCEFSNLPK